MANVNTSAAPPTHAGTAGATAVRVGDLLLERGLITSDQLDAALAHQRSHGGEKLLGEVLVELSFVSEEQVMAVLAEAYGLPYARLEPALVDSEVVELLPRDFIEQHAVVPMFLVRGMLTVAVAEPANVFLVEEIQRRTGHGVQIVAATGHSIQQVLDQLNPRERVLVVDVMDDLKDDDVVAVERAARELAEAVQAGDDSPTVKLVNYLMYQAVQEGASDIHIEPGEDALRVRFRVDGRLYEKMTPPAAMLPAIVSRLKIMSSLDISERRLPQDGGVRAVIDRRPIDLRVSTMPGRFGEKAVIRIIDKRNVVTSLDEIGFGGASLEQYRALIQRPNGIVLVTGPTGSGKSTTLYATLHEINDVTRNISTVEDPVEYNLPGVNQFQVNNKAGFTFASALRSLLRQDPDVVMVGEIRDQETARIAVQAALTGHLVFATLHTNDAPSAVTRLYNIGVEPYLIAASLRGVLAQRLVRRLCPHCRRAAQPEPGVEPMLATLAGEERVEGGIYEPGECARCRRTGYSGRLGMFELYVPGDESLDAISRGAGLQELRTLAGADGVYHKLGEDGVAKLLAGHTSVEELVQATSV
ncbi:MAG: ATPase, T2SS/T4P/T4SS family [Phycisphaeraceae bacterium]